VRRLHALLIAGLLLLPVLGSCRRREPGTCADHVDCDPGFDCVDRRCTRRAPVQGQGETQPALGGRDAESSDPTPPPPPPPPSPSLAPGAGEDPAVPAPAKKAAPPIKAPSLRNPPALDPASPAPGQREPLWKTRRRNT